MTVLQFRIPPLQIVEEAPRRRTLKIDATCVDAEVRYPTDIDLLHDGCKVINRYIDKLCTRLSLVHPITHYKLARAAYLEVIKTQEEK